MTHSLIRKLVRLYVLLAAVCAQFACDKGKDSAKFVIADWVEEHKPAVDALRAKLKAAAEFVEPLPADSVRAVDTIPAIKPITDQWEDGENMAMLNGASVPGLPEYGRDEGKSLEAGETSMSIAYTGYVDLASAYSMVDKGEMLYVKQHGEGVGLAKKIAKIQYVIIGREGSYTPGTVDKISRTFTPGSFEGVAHIVDLEGPKHIGSVAFSARNTGSFESYEGSAEYMLRADLQHEAIRAFHAELRKHFPEIKMPEPPQKE